MIKKGAKQFCLNTALHGYRFIVLPKRILLEKCFWIGICLISFLAAITLLSMSWLNFREDPIVTVTDTNHYPIWFFPFPTVTVCDLNIIPKNGIQRLAKRLVKSSKNKELIQDIKLFAYLINYNLYKKDFLANLTNLQNLLDQKNISIKSAIATLSKRCEDMLVKCVWKGEERRCESIFEKIKTTNGFCCSFNYYAIKNHTFGGIMPYKSPKQPRRVSACGYLTGLEAIVDITPSEYMASRIPSFGYKIMLHNPFDFPDWNSKTTFIRMKTSNFIGVNPRRTYCSEDVKDIPIKKRMCWFPQEKELIYFGQYSFQNCMVECRLNLTLEMCHCLPYFYIPTKEIDDKIGRICNLKDIPCLSKYSEFIRSSVPGFNFSNLEPNHTYGSEKGVCNCLPDCELIDYTFQTTYGILNREFSMNRQSLFGGINLINHSVVRVFFDDLVGFKNRRDVRFDWHTLLAFYGGLLGFFMGFSFISGIEILYFFTVRPLNKLVYEKNTKRIIMISPNRKKKCFTSF